MRLSDKQLLRISLAVSALGILGLFLLFSFSQLPVTSIQDAKSFLDGDDVHVQGKILRSDLRGNTTFLVIEQSCTLDAVIFDKVDLEEGAFVAISGSMSTHNDKREVLVEEISSIS